MDQDQMNPMPQGGANEPGNGAPVADAPERTSHIGIVIGAIIVVGLLILGGLYWWGSQIEREQVADEEGAMMEDGDMANDPQTEALMEQSSSDEVNAIEEDLDATDLENLDAELNQMEAELDAEMEGEF